MLSERQIEHLLENCEEKLAAPLTNLRERLLRDRNHESVIWELVLLHVFLDRFSGVQPERGPSMPDLTVRSFWRHRLSVEAALVTSPRAEALRRCAEFQRWTYRQVAKLGIPMNGAHIAIRACRPGITAQIPQPHYWAGLLKDPSWKAFAQDFRREGHAIWSCPQGNINVRVEPRHDGVSTAEPLLPELPTDIRKHPVYREIRDKARQVAGWSGRLRRSPIVLAICIPEAGHEFSEHRGIHDYTVRRAVLSALLDHERLSDLDRINVLRQRLMFHPEGVRVESNRLRVAGSQLISAVLVVRLQSRAGPGLLPKSEAKCELYLNPHARHPMDARQLREVLGLNFNSIEYGPGWESWHNTPSGSLKLRNARRGGLMEFRSGAKGEIEVRIPTMRVLAILSGESTAQAVFEDYAGPPSALDVFRRAFASELTVESVTIIDADPATRSEQQIAFRFGRGRAPVVARAREAKQKQGDPDSDHVQ